VGVRTNLIEVKKRTTPRAGESPRAARVRPLRPSIKGEKVSSSKRRTKIKAVRAKVARWSVLILVVQWGKKRQNPVALSATMSVPKRDHLNQKRGVVPTPGLV